MKTVLNQIPALAVAGALIFAGAACGGGSSGGSEGAGSGRGTTAVTIEGTLSSASSSARRLGSGEGGIPGVTINALGDADTTDKHGNFTLFADGNTFPGGAVQFIISGNGIESAVVLNQVAGGPGANAFVDFYLENDGSISGESSDLLGNVLSSTGARCGSVGTFVDGGYGALWKPHSESTGTVVILMPAEYRDAHVEVLNSRNEVVATVIRSHCCQHNGNRAHFYLNRSANSLAGAGTPLTVRFTFPDGRTDCREIPDPRQRYD